MALESLSAISPGVILLLVLLVIWSGIWKALALWKSAGRKDLVWFIILIIFNTAGILEILYLFVFSKGKNKTEKIKTKKRK